jgi:integrase
MSQNAPADWTLADAKIVTTDEARLILARAKEYGEIDPTWKRDYDWFAIAVNTGLRVSEVGHIEKTDVLPLRWFYKHKEAVA